MGVPAAPTSPPSLCRPRHTKKKKKAWRAITRNGPVITAKEVSAACSVRRSYDCSMHPPTPPSPSPSESLSPRERGEALRVRQLGTKVIVSKLHSTLNSRSRTQEFIDGQASFPTVVFEVEVQTPRILFVLHITAEFAPLSARFEDSKDCLARSCVDLTRNEISWRVSRDRSMKKSKSSESAKFKRVRENMSSAARSGRASSSTDAITRLSCACNIDFFAGSTCSFVRSLASSETGQSALFALRARSLARRKRKMALNYKCLTRRSVRRTSGSRFRRRPPRQGKEASELSGDTMRLRLKAAPKATPHLLCTKHCTLSYHR